MVDREDQHLVCVQYSAHDNMAGKGAQHVSKQYIASKLRQFSRNSTWRLVGSREQHLIGKPRVADNSKGYLARDNMAGRAAQHVS